MIFNLSLIAGDKADTHLAWRVIVHGFRTTDGATGPWMVFVDSMDGRVLLVIDELRTHGDPDPQGHRPGEDFDIETGNHDVSASCWIMTTSDDQWFNEHGTNLRLS
jgi:hypothetical protein